MYLLDKQKRGYSEEIHERKHHAVPYLRGSSSGMVKPCTLPTDKHRKGAAESKASASQMMYKSSQVSEHKDPPSTNVSPRTKKSLSISKTLTSDAALAFY